ncbi:Helix-turn-helix domain-containing protein [Pseudobutyrivibrio sp. YE44]|uniref:response regulator transcription factor n=1 Tax=Pseudobutyrivibrio sp. YE44 TaxID=1520802 RepID=UPI0008842538|nr:response regulator [Pseudobutyrivibrio sp. YE44]SDB24519.1 Helix-turn-helix domain-containing protein [Pseudobutyrivibrio sp. YE44]
MYKVLIADDEPIERQVISKKLRSYFPGQVDLFWAENGVEAVEMFEKQNCQIALLDIAMPGKNGLEAAEEIRSFDSNCSIIFLTAFDEFNYAKKAISVKALDYLLKPGTDEELVSAFEEAFSIADQCQQEQDKSMDICEDSLGLYSEEQELSYNARLILKDAMEYINEHYKEDISLQDVAGVIGYSDVYFCKIFKQHLGKSFIVFLNELRIDKAKQLLEKPAINIKDVCFDVGYRDANYFTRVFKRLTGMTPSEYRNGVLR